MSIKVAEIFYSLQGEGKYLGVPSLFLRVFGCNFQCQGFAMPKGQLSEERLQIDPSKYQKYEDLPLVHTGCDSYASWDVRFKHLSPVLTITEIVDKIQQLLPEGKFSQDKHLVLTGGEPLLGWQKQYIELFKEFEKRNMNLSHVTFETNGTQPLRDDLSSYMYDKIKEVTFSISSKLPSSGEKWIDAIRPEIVNTYFNPSAGRNGYFKWVLSSEEDYIDVISAINSYRLGNISLPVYVMPAGGTGKYYEDNKIWVSNLAMKEGWRYSPRLQVELWKNAWGT